MGESLLFTIEDGIRFLGISDMTADKLLTGSRDEPKQSKVLSAADLLKERLLEGDLPAAELMETFAELGFGEKTLKTAKKELGVKSRKEGSTWFWSLDEGSRQTD